MKLLPLFIFLFCSLFISCKASVGTDYNLTDINLNIVYNKSQQTIERINNARHANGLDAINHDTILDKTCWKILADNSYRRNDNSIREDSVRNHLFEMGVIDYQYEITEFSDKDTTALFKKFTTSKYSGNVKMGYYHYGDKYLTIKTTSHLKIAHRYSLIQSEPVSLKGKTNIKVTYGPATYIFKAPKEGKYFYQTLDHIPLNSENLNKINQFEVNTVPTKELSNQNYPYEIEIKVEQDSYLLIKNESNDRLILVK